MLPFLYTLAAHQATKVEPWFVFWRAVVEPKYPWLTWLHWFFFVQRGTWNNHCFSPSCSVLMWLLILEKGHFGLFKVLLTDTTPGVLLSATFPLALGVPIQGLTCHSIFFLIVCQSHLMLTWFEFWPVHSHRSLNFLGPHLFTETESMFLSRKRRPILPWG